MALDAQSQALLEVLLADTQPVETLTAIEARATSDARRARSQLVVEPVWATEDHVVAGPGGPLPVRIYRPGGELGLPAVVFFHGGGWVLCDLDSHDPMCRSIARGAHCVVVSVDYRRAPEHRFPAAMEDAYTAAQWVLDNAGSLGLDPDRVAVMGDSAGGNLAAAVAIAARDRGGPRLAAQVLLYPVTQHRFDTPSYVEHADGCYLTAAAMRWYWQQYLDDPRDGEHPHASPLLADDLTGLPPAVVVTAECDPLRDEGEKYAARLRSAGVRTSARRYDGVFHGFLSMTAALDVGRTAMGELCEAVREVLSAGAVASDRGAAIPGTG